MTFAVYALIALACSVIILIVSMLVTNRIWGGVDFGPLKSVILKGGGLLIAVNLVALIPGFGGLLVLAVWFIGLMLLFKLDLWQTFTLVVVNGVLNFLVRMMLHNAMSI